MLMGSDTRRAPFGKLNELAPLNVTFCNVSGWIPLTPADPFVGRAMVTADIGRFVRPNALLKRRRIVDAPMERWSV